MISNSIKEFFKVDSKYKLTIVSIILSAIVFFVSYNAFIVYGFNSPDGIVEGFHFYINRDWAIAGCGRWFLALVNMAHANLVFPWLIMIECFITNWLSAHTLCKIFDIKNKWLYCLSCAFFIVLPTFIEISLYTNSAFSYSLSVLLSILYVYFNLKDNKYYSILSAICLGFAMGSYQGQIGVAIGLTVLLLIVNILENKKILQFLIKSIVSGIIGLIIYITGLNICLSIYNLQLTSRAASFSLSNMISSFPSRFLQMYKIFFNTFNQMILNRYIIYLIILIIFIYEVIMIIINFLNNKNYINLLLIVVLIALLPVCFNFVGIIFPEHEMTPLMLTPNFIILFFVIYLLKYIHLYKITSCLLCLCFILLTWTYVLTANATFDCYRLSYDSYKTQFSNVLDKVYDLEGYELNKTKIVVIGYPDDSVLRDNINTYKYVLNPYPNYLYWGNQTIDIITTYQYLINEFGVNPGSINNEEYNSIVSLDECKELPSWPNKDSVKMINGYAVIKFGDINE